jgi:hypothetical protein
MDWGGRRDLGRNTRHPELQSNRGNGLAGQPGVACDPGSFRPEAGHRDSPGLSCSGRAGPPARRRARSRIGHQHLYGPTTRSIPDSRVVTEYASPLRRPRACAPAMFALTATPQRDEPLMAAVVGGKPHGLWDGFLRGPDGFSTGRWTGFPREASARGVRIGAWSYGPMIRGSLGDRRRFPCGSTIIRMAPAS